MALSGGYTLSPAVVIGTHNLAGHTEYTISVSLSHPKGGGGRWIVSRRYRQFDHLFATLRPHFRGMPKWRGSPGPEIPKLPPKRFFGRMDAQFIALRKAGLPVPRTVAVLSEAGADRAAESFAGGAFRAAEDRAGQWLAPGGGGGALLRGPSDLAAALAAAAAQYPIVLQAWPECGRAHLLFANHKLDSATVVSAAPADAEMFDRRGLPREFLDELSAWLRRNDVALARVEVGFDAEMAGCQM